ncbi:MAG: protein translocase subunit SecD [Clostridia bacterium]|nr:protein translocase subunit SecD [Clostridia bacterium]
MYRGSLGRLLVVTAAIILAGVLATGPILRHMNLGLDLRGGVHVTLQAKETQGKPVSAEDMSQLQAVMRERVDQLGVSEPIIQQEGANRLIVELAGVKNPDEAVKLIGKTALLEFRTEDNQKVILTGRDLKTAKAVFNQQTNKPEIALEFNPDGTRIFAQETRRLVQQYPDERDPKRVIGIYLDGQPLTTPTVQQEIPDGKAVITGNFTYDEAANLAALLRGGALPVNVEIIEKRTVGPTLGTDSLAKSQIAVVVALIAVALFMIVLYRVPGVVADLSLVVYALIVLGALALAKATLTLPSIAALLLSVGMAVDANILIYERLKEELRRGKTLRAAVDAGFRHAFRTILDSNVTTVLAALVLWYFGSGPIRGFAVTLTIGIAASMFTAISLTRWLLGLVVSTGLFKDQRWYGVREVS